MKSWLEALSPDFAATWRRFPFPILFALVGTMLLVLGTNQISVFRDEVWARASMGMFTGAAFGVGGVMFAESRPDRPRLGAVLMYLLPVVTAAALLITDTTLIFPYLLPVIGVLWTSVAASTVIGRGAEREAAQNRFWWLNHQAIATASIAGAAFVIIFIGLVVIERALTELFHLSVNDIFLRWVLPFVGLFFAPVYWLSTIPKLSDYDATRAEKPDFIAQAIGFLGQFVLAPLLLIYGLILLAYTVQIFIVGSLPQGTLGWMVLGFVATGAGTWLLLYPPFLRDRPLVKIFRRGWFWLTLIPLALFAYAVWIRIDAYGLTPERVMLIGGGIWAVLLAAIFLGGHGDIRLIPGLAGVILTLMTIGPWNVDNAPRLSQAARLSAILTKVGLTSADSMPNWTMNDEREARDLVYYLMNNKARGHLEGVLADHGVPITATGDYFPVTPLTAMKIDQIITDDPAIYQSIKRNPSDIIDLADTPFFMGNAPLHSTPNMVGGSVWVSLQDGKLLVSDDFTNSTPIDLAAWVARNPDDPLADPVIPFEHEGTKYRYVVTYGTIESQPDGPVKGRFLSFADGLLFRGAPKPKP